MCTLIPQQLLWLEDPMYAPWSFFSNQPSTLHCKYQRQIIATLLLTLVVEGMTTLLDRSALHIAGFAVGLCAVVYYHYSLDRLVFVSCVRSLFGVFPPTTLWFCVRTHVSIDTMWTLSLVSTTTIDYSRWRSWWLNWLSISIWFA